MSTKIRPELQIKPGSQSQVLTTIDGKATWANAQVPDISNITNLESQLETKADKVDTYTKEQVDQKVSDLVGSAPETLNTLQEIAAALNNDENMYSTLTSTLTQYVDTQTQGVAKMEDVDRLKVNTIETFNELKNAVAQSFQNVASANTSIPNDIKYSVSNSITAGTNISGMSITVNNRLNIEVYLNGLLQESGSDYTLSVDGSNYRLSMHQDLVSGDVVIVKHRPRYFMGIGLNSAETPVNNFDPATRMIS